MTIHTGLRGRNVRVTRVLDIGMTILTIQAKLANVETMTILYWLNWSVSNVRVLWGKEVPNKQDCENATAKGKQKR